MKPFTETKDKERRAQKIAEKQNLEKRKVIRDRHFHLVDEDDEEEQAEHEYDYLLKGK
jgi:hypothetical protein